VVDCGAEGDVYIVCQKIMVLIVVTAIGIIIFGGWKCSNWVLIFFLFELA
jgi:hypothetical protein